MSNNPIYGLILAGGSGSRLWPLSREMFPKQLLKLNSDNNETLYQQTISLLTSIVDKENLLTITNIKLESELKYQYYNLYKKDKNNKNEPVLIIEPIQKNTAAAIGAATLYILNNLKDEKKDPVIIIAPSDHLITEKEKFVSIIEKAIELAEKNYIVTLGIPPNKPEIAYGYIKVKEDFKNKGYCKVVEFIEKPELKKARQLLDEGNHYWNSGIFIFKASTILEELKTYCFKLYDGIKKIDYNCPLLNYDEYIDLPDISIDYAVMEKSNKLVVLPAEIGWSDLGSWLYVYESVDKDKNQNFICGNVITSNCENSLIYGSDKLVAAVGLDNVVIVSTEDATLICDKEKTQEVKHIYNQLKDRKDSTVKFHQTQLRPWGYFTLLQSGDNFKIQSLNIKPKCCSSLHMHYHKNKHWTVVDGIAEVRKNGQKKTVKTGESIDIIATEKHQVYNPGVIDLKIIEVQSGNYFGEDDIIRFKE